MKRSVQIEDRLKAVQQPRTCSKAIKSEESLTYSTAVESQKPQPKPRSLTSKGKVLEEKKKGIFIVGDTNVLGLGTRVHVQDKDIEGQVTVRAGYSLEDAKCSVKNDIDCLKDDTVLILCYGTNDIVQAARSIKHCCKGE